MDKEIFDLTEQIRHIKSKLPELDLLHLEKKYPFVGLYEGYKKTFYDKSAWKPLFNIIACFYFYDMNADLKSLFASLIGINISLLVALSYQKRNPQLKESMCEIEKERELEYQKLAELKNARQELLDQKYAKRK